MKNHICNIALINVISIIKASILNTTLPCFLISDHVNSLRQQINSDFKSILQIERKKKFCNFSTRMTNTCQHLSEQLTGKFYRQ